MVLTRTLSTCKGREIRARIDRKLDLWERVFHAGLVGDALAEVRAREGRVKIRKEEEEDRLDHSIHSTLLTGKLRHEVCWAIYWEGREGCLLQGKSTQRPGNRLQTSSGRNTLTCVYPPWKIPRARPLRSIGRCQRQCPLTSLSTASSWWHTIYQTPLDTWEQKQLS